MGIGPMHLFVLAAIALLFFGPSKLPALGKSMGEAIKGFKDAMNDLNTESDNIAKTVREPVRTQSVSQDAPISPSARNETIVHVTETTAEHITDPTAASKPKTPVS